jgi:hypothetical protein
MKTTIAIAITTRRMNRRTGFALRTRRAIAAADLFVLCLDFAGISAIAPQLQNYRAGFYHAHATPITIDVNFVRII